METSTKISIDFYKNFYALLLDFYNFYHNPYRHIAPTYGTDSSLIA